MTITFAELGVPERLVARLTKHGIENPFPIQEASIPDGLAGRDVCGKAPTGSGKTLAFGIVAIDRAQGSAPRRPRCLVLVPTRELASQVQGELAMLAGDRAKRVIAVYGGTGYGPTRNALNRGVDIVVACPGRLEDLIEQRMILLGDVKTVILDEADRMADMGFLPAVRRILDATSPQRQVLLFSATFGKEVEAVVSKYQRSPARHDVSEDEGGTGQTRHHFWETSNAQRLAIAVSLVDRHGRALVFCRTKRGADRVAKQLAAAGVTSAAIHGDRTQAQRERALAAFGAGKVDALVATDVAARGIHVDDLPCVIHFDPPNDPTDYLHRSGRTGRAGRDGTVVSLVTEDQRGIVKGLQRALGLRTELRLPEGQGQGDANTVGTVSDGELLPKLLPSESFSNAGRPRQRSSSRRSSSARPSNTRSDRPSRPSSTRSDRSSSSEFGNGRRRGRPTKGTTARSA